MDVGSECSALESIEDNELFANNPDRISSIDGDINEVQAKGSCSNEIHDAGDREDVDTDSLPCDGLVKEGVGTILVGKTVNSTPLAAKSPDGGSPSTTKGYGLRKWRRIKREVVKDVSLNADSSKILKRGLSGSTNPSKPMNERKGHNDGSVGSTNVLRNVAIADGDLTDGPSLESKFVIGSAFAAATDSENSEDRSSKSSTAASAPRMRYDLPAIPGYGREKIRVKNVSGKGVSSSAQRVQQGKGRVDSSKKPKGERVKIEKENSHSSIESDSRSSNFIFMQRVYPVISNGKQSGGSMYYDGENSDENHAGGQELSDEVPTGYGKENIDDIEDLSRDDLAADASWVNNEEEKSENHLLSTDLDPLVESILTLHSVQEALENEVKKLGEIGMIITAPTYPTFSDKENHESISSDQFDSENLRQSEFQMLNLKENVKNLESKLEETVAMLKVKESRVEELEATLRTDPLQKLKPENTGDVQHEKSRGTEVELEGLFKQKIEAEVEYIALKDTIQNLIVAAGDQITLLKEQEALAGESKPASTNKELEHLEEHYTDFLVMKDAAKLRKRTRKVTSCFLTQLILLAVAFYLFVSQLLPPSGVVVPT